MKSFMKSILVALFVIIAFVAVSMFSGCSTLGRAIDENPATTKAAVYVGTLKYIGENSDKALRVENTASEILSGMSGGTTIDQLDGRLRALIQWDRLDMADAILLHALLTELRSTMVATIGEGLLSPDDAVRIERVAGWVIDAARLAQ